MGPCVPQRQENWRHGLYHLEALSKHTRGQGCRGRSARRQGYGSGIDGKETGGTSQGRQGAAFPSPGNQHRNRSGKPGPAPVRESWTKLSVRETWTTIYIFGVPAHRADAVREGLIHGKLLGPHRQAPPPDRGTGAKVGRSANTVVGLVRSAAP